MNFGRNLAAFAVVAALSVSSAFGASLPMNGSQGFADTGTTTANTGDIDTATVFTFGNVLTTGSQTGDFTAVGEFLGAQTLDISNIGSFSFGDANFGHFTGSAFATGAPANAYYILGTFTPGIEYNTFGPGPAELDVSFTQAGGAGGAISASGSLITPAIHSVPEPSSMALALVGGLIGLVAVRRNRK